MSANIDLATLKISGRYGSLKLGNSKFRILRPKSRNVQKLIPK